MPAHRLGQRARTRVHVALRRRDVGVPGAQLQLVNRDGYGSGGYGAGYGSGYGYGSPAYYGYAYSYPRSYGYYPRRAYYARRPYHRRYARY